MPTNGDPREVIYSWALVSDHRAVTYEQIIRRNGERSCDCPSWVFFYGRQKDKTVPRICKHLQRLEPEMNTVFNLFQAGRPLPMNEVAAPTNQRSPAYTPGDTGIRLRPRRMITID